ATVCFYLDNTETGRVDRRPYAIELDTTRVADGEHSVKWSALDASGNEISKGSIFLVVTNKMRLDPEKIGSSAGPIPGIDDESDSSGQTADKTASGVEVVTYSNSDYDISLKHPIEWSVKDQTAALPDDWNKGYWLVISTDPVADAGHVVNIRHRLMQQEHTAESFIKFTPYVADWEQVSVKGRIVFVTTSGSPAAKRVMHRLMMLDGRHLWMMNCIDTTGEPAEKSKALFLQISESIEPEASPESGPIEAEQ
ncbi:MAG TPA: hypothetical protein PLZ21_10375, partial [Armatimonadota bacterium]|nr:hypothetical protein [Armatimonadota bacterium]